MTWEYVTYCEKQKSQIFTWNTSPLYRRQTPPLYVMLFKSKMPMQQHQATIPTTVYPPAIEKRLWQGFCIHHQYQLTSPSNPNFELSFQNRYDLQCSLVCAPSRS
ncbi:hypothetical protein BVRB_4g086380 [Beta vulgaris subsp. vulgaris]|nr:hypothetical protein BVRB_4g086380 [Beta vulgaris subsp. vulgaris]